MWLALTLRLDILARVGWLLRCLYSLFQVVACRKISPRVANTVRATFLKEAVFAHNAAEE